MSNFQEILLDLDTKLKQGAEGIVADVMSLESADLQGNAASELHLLQRTLRDSFNELSMLSDAGEEVDYTAIDECVKAGTIAYLASAKPRDYMNALRKGASKSNAMSMESVTMGGAGFIDTVDLQDYSQESFDEGRLDGLATVNAVFNMLAARQEPALEAMFPTKVYGVAENGITLTTQLQEVITEARHPNGGAPIEVNRRKLFRGFLDHTILEGSSVDLIPFADPNGTADANFVPSAVVATEDVKWGRVPGVVVKSRPLAIGSQFNLLSLCQHPGVTGNKQLGISDQIAYGVRLTDLYMTIGDGEGGKVVHFNTQNMARNYFLKSAQGRGRQTTLNWPTKDLVISGETKNLGGVEIPELAAAIDAGYKVQLRATVTGEMNLDDGETEVNASPVKVQAVINAATKQPVSLADGVGKTIKEAVEALQLKLVGYKINPRASNSNWRFNGPIIDVTPHTETYLIPPGSPITVLTPPNEQANQAKIQGLTNAMKIRTTNQGITAFLNYHETLLSAMDAIKAGLEVDIEGTGRHIVDAYAAKVEVDVLERLASWKSHERAFDVQKVLVDALRVEAWKMFVESNYSAALRLQTGSSDVRPKVIIWTDTYLPKYLLGMGGLIEEKNLLGTTMDCEIHAIDDYRLRGKIFMTFTRGRPGVEDLTSFGVHAFIPELNQQMTVDRDGATKTVNRVVPRNFHLPILPIVASIEVSNLEEALLNLEQAGGGAQTPPTGP